MKQHRAWSERELEKFRRTQDAQWALILTAWSTILLTQPTYPAGGHVSATP